MPWKEANVVELRKEFVLEALKADLPFTALCRKYGISSKTGYKWKERFLELGTAGLFDQSRRPIKSPAQLTEDLVCKVIRLKTKHPRWGPKKICQLFARQHPASQVPSLSSVKRMLAKAGLVEPRRRRPAKLCGRVVNRFKPGQPNELWTVDFKGWWYSPDKARIEPLTVRDDFSRYVLCAQLLVNGKSDTVREYFVRLFEKYGMPQVIRSDNGSPFACTRAPLGLSRLAAWWVALGIQLDRIEPGHPEQNGGHERMHRDLALEVQGRVDGGLVEQQAALEVWRREFNYERPHEALGMRTPAELYTKSKRRFDPKPVTLSYPQEYLQRKVKSNGAIKISNREIPVSTAIGGWDVGLKLVGNQHYRLWFGQLCLGDIQLGDETFSAVSEVT